MEITIEDDITFEEYKYLRGTTDWTQLTDEQVSNIIKHTPFKVRGKVDGKTVAMGKAVFDFGYNAFLSDIIVAPEAQGKGIGKKIVLRLVELVKANVRDTDYIQFCLLAAPGKDGFYEKLGFVKRDGSNGYGMNLRFNA